MNLYSYTTDELTETVNQGLDLVLQKACKKGLITEDQLSNLVTLRAVVSDRPNIFSKFWKKFSGSESGITMHIISLEKVAE